MPYRDNNNNNGHETVRNANTQEVRKRPNSFFFFFVVVINEGHLWSTDSIGLNAYILLFEKKWCISAEFGLLACSIIKYQ